MENQAEKRMDHEMKTGVCGGYIPYSWLAGNDGMDNRMETTVGFGVLWELP